MICTKPHAGDQNPCPLCGYPGTGLYRTIVADPPWHYEPGKWVANDRFHNSGMPYETMAVGDIKALNIPAATSAHLYLWTTNRYLRDAYDVAEAWGFRFSTLLVWCKPLHGEGPGGAFTITSEYVLFCRRGNLPTRSKELSTWFEAPRGRHSEKPDAFLDLVEQVSPGPYLELFARRQRLGWDTWGNEALEHVALGGTA